MCKQWVYLITPPRPSIASCAWKMRGCTLCSYCLPRLFRLSLRPECQWCRMNAQGRKSCGVCCCSLMWMQRRPSRRPDRSGRSDLSSLHLSWWRAAAAPTRCPGTMRLSAGRPQSGLAFKGIYCWRWGLLGHPGSPLSCAKQTMRRPVSCRQSSPACVAVEKSRLELHAGSCQLAQLGV